jgi:hypothetical protein
MDAFVRRLVEHLLAEERPLSRNRHFHTFDTPEGRSALRIARRLGALRKSVLLCAAEGGAVQLGEKDRSGTSARRELRIARAVGSHRAYLSEDELALLCTLPGVGEAMAGAAGRPQH